MNLQRLTVPHQDWWLPCGHKRVRVTPTLGTRPARRCTICRTSYLIIVRVPPSGRTDVVWVEIVPELQEVPV